MLIHCKEGAHRGPFASAVWLMAKTGRTMHEVVKYLEQLRCLVHLRPDVKDRLRHHDRELSHLFRDLRAGQVYHGGPWADQPLPAIMSSDELLRHLDRDKKQHKEPDKEPDNGGQSWREACPADASLLLTSTNLAWGPERAPPGPRPRDIAGALVAI